MTKCTQAQSEIHFLYVWKVRRWEAMRRTKQRSNCVRIMFYCTQHCWKMPEWIWMLWHWKESRLYGLALLCNPPSSSPQCVESFIWSNPSSWSASLNRTFPQHLNCGCFTTLQLVWGLLSVNNWRWREEKDTVSCCYPRWREESDIAGLMLSAPCFWFCSLGFRWPKQW